LLILRRFVQPRELLVTLDYIQATKAKYVVTDNTCAHAAGLALEVTRRLGIPARPSTTIYFREWGLA